jgi:uncharacterized membrane protein
MQSRHHCRVRATHTWAQRVTIAAFVALALTVLVLSPAPPAAAAPVCFDLVGNIVPCDSSASSTTTRPTTTATAAPTTSTRATTTTVARTTTSATSAASATSAPSTTTTTAATTTTVAAARQIRAAPAVTLRPPPDSGEPSSKAKTYGAIAAVSLLLLIALVGPELRAWSRRRRSHPAAGS